MARYIERTRRIRVLVSEGSEDYIKKELADSYVSQGKSAVFPAGSVREVLTIEHSGTQVKIEGSASSVWVADDLMDAVDMAMDVELEQRSGPGLRL